MPEHCPTPILFVHHRSELGDTPSSLSYVIRTLVADPPAVAAERR